MFGVDEGLFQQKGRLFQVCYNASMSTNRVECALNQVPLLRVESFDIKTGRNIFDVAAQIANTIVCRPQQTFQLVDGEYQHTLVLENGILKAMNPSKKADEWLSAIATMLTQPIAAQFFPKVNPPETITIQRSAGGWVIANLVQMHRR